MNTEGCTTSKCSCGTTNCNCGTSNCVTKSCGVKCFSWTPIIIGALFATGLSFLLNLFSTALGLSIYNVDAEGLSHLTVAGIVGFGIGVIAIMFFSGWVAGFLGKAHCEKKHCGCVLGFSVWCLALILAILLASPFTKFSTGYSSYLTNTVATTAIASVSENIPKPTTAAATDEKAVNDLGKTTFVVFLMFFLGAISSTCGGHAGSLSCCCNLCRKPEQKL
jgi:hypothetical protein